MTSRPFTCVYNMPSHFYLEGDSSDGSDDDCASPSPVAKSAFNVVKQEYIAPPPVPPLHVSPAHTVGPPTSRSVARSEWTTSVEEESSKLQSVSEVPRKVYTGDMIDIEVDLFEVRAWQRFPDDMMVRTCLKKIVVSFFSGFGLDRDLGPWLVEQWETNSATGFETGEGQLGLCTRSLKCGFFFF